MLRSCPLFDLFPSASRSRTQQISLFAAAKLVALPIGDR